MLFFKVKDLEVIEATSMQLKSKPLTSDNLKFGHTYADHMMEADWSNDKGWTRPLISPLHNFNLHPGSKVYIYVFFIY